MNGDGGGGGREERMGMEERTERGREREREREKGGTEIGTAGACLFVCVCCEVCSMTARITEWLSAAFSSLLYFLLLPPPPPLLPLRPPACLLVLPPFIHSQPHTHTPRKTKQKKTKKQKKTNVEIVARQRAEESSEVRCAGDPARPFARSQTTPRAAARHGPIGHPPCRTSGLNPTGCVNRGGGGEEWGALFTEGREENRAQRYVCIYICVVKYM